MMCVGVICECDILAILLVISIHINTLLLAYQNIGIFITLIITEILQMDILCDIACDYIQIIILYISVSLFYPVLSLLYTHAVYIVLTYWFKFDTVLKGISTCPEG